MALFGHEGGNTSGKFCFTPTVTDIAAGWRVNRSVKYEADRQALEAIMHMRRVFPYHMIGTVSDDGPEFINHHLFDYCPTSKIIFTRSRTVPINDGAHVEQTN